MLNEIQLIRLFYTKLYDTKDDYLYGNSIDSFLGKLNTSTLTSEQRDSLEKELSTINECFATLKTLLKTWKNKTPRSIFDAVRTIYSMIF